MIMINSIHYQLLSTLKRRMPEFEFEFEHNQFNELANDDYDDVDWTPRDLAQFAADDANTATVDAAVGAAHAAWAAIHPNSRATSPWVVEWLNTNTTTNGWVRAECNANRNGFTAWIEDGFDWIGSDCIEPLTPESIQIAALEEFECPVCLCDCSQGWTCNTCHNHVCEDCIRHWTNTNIAFHAPNNEGGEQYYLQTNEAHNTCPHCRAVIVDTLL
jgi:hypothetical protein